MRTKRAPKIEHVTIRLEELEAFQLGEPGEQESGRFKGLAIRFNSPIETFPNRTLVKPGAFAKTIAERANRVKILLGHDTRRIIGAPTMLQETGDGLEVAASLNKTVDGNDTATMLRHLKSIGKLEAAEMSIGFDAINFEMFEDPETREMFRIVTEARLWEISVVAFGADPTTEVREAAQASHSASSPSHASADSGSDDSNPTDELCDLVAESAETLSSTIVLGPEEIQEGRILSGANLAKVRGALKALQALIDAVESKAKPKDKDAAKREKQQAELDERLAIDRALAEIEMEEVRLAERDQC